MSVQSSKKQMVRRFICLLIAFTFLTGNLTVLAEVQGASSGNLPLRYIFWEHRGDQQLVEFVDLSGVPRYQYLPVRIPSEVVADINVPASAIEGLSVIHYEGVDAVHWNRDTDFIHFYVDVAVAGDYNIYVYQLLPVDGNLPAVRSVQINEELPFIEANNVSFFRRFVDATEPIINSLGDETRPSQKQIVGWIDRPIMESTGQVSEPLRFYFPAGRNRVTMEYVRGQMFIGGITLRQPRILPSYQAYRAEMAAIGAVPRNHTIHFGAHDTVVEKSMSTIRREFNPDPSVTPRSPDGSRRLNILGGTRWSQGNSSVTWEFEVPEAGLYRIGIRYLQNFTDGLPSFRQIAINGEVPFEELKEVAFIFDTDWQFLVLGDENGPFEIYLEAGVNHITMTTVMGPLTEVIQVVRDASETISNILMDITMIAGLEPDPNFNFNFFVTIPDLQENLTGLADKMRHLNNVVNNIAGGRNVAMSGNFLSIADTLDHISANQMRVNTGVWDLNNALLNMGTWYTNLQNTPLAIDRFVVGGEDTDWAHRRASIWQRILATIQTLLRSFTRDFTAVGSVLEDGVEVHTNLNVWVARGTEWAETIKELADSMFTPQTGIAININVFPASQLQAGNANALMLSITSGRAPDVALGVDANSPVEFAIRDAVLDLSVMPGFDDVVQRFIPEIMTPFAFQGGVFALPETMGMNVMFYRRDILHRLEIGVPDTREELYNFVLPILFQNGMNFFFPSGGPWDANFSQFLFQHGGDFYTEDGFRSALGSPEAFAAFREYTELFTHYGIPLIANFYNRFRTGDMPIGMGSFQTYLQLSVAAPELAGMWGIAPLPGIRMENGEVNRAAGGLAAQTSIIMAQTEHPEAAWKFLDWWTDTETQIIFAEEVESLMGMQSRWNSANIEAFRSLPWNRGDLDVFEEQWRWAQEVPIVLGGYFTSRHIMNAWTSTVIGGEPPRDTLSRAVRNIDRELRRMQEEHGIFVD